MQKTRPFTAPSNNFTSVVSKKSKQYGEIFHLNTNATAKVFSVEGQSENGFEQQTGCSALGSCAPEDINKESDMLDDYSNPQNSPEKPEVQACQNDASNGSMHNGLINNMRPSSIQRRNIEDTQSIIEEKHESGEAEISYTYVKKGIPNKISQIPRTAPQRKTHFQLKEIKYKEKKKQSKIAAKLIFTSADVSIKPIAGCSEIEFVAQPFFEESLLTFEVIACEKLIKSPQANILSHLGKVYDSIQTSADASETLNILAYLFSLASISKVTYCAIFKFKLPCFD